MACGLIRRRCRRGQRGCARQFRPARGDDRSPSTGIARNRALVDRRTDRIDGLRGCSLAVEYAGFRFDARLRQRQFSTRIGDRTLRAGVDGCRGRIVRGLRGFGLAPRNLLLLLAEVPAVAFGGAVDAIIPMTAFGRRTRRSGETAVGCFRLAVQCRGDCGSGKNTDEDCRREFCGRAWTCASPVMIRDASRSQSRQRLGWQWAAIPERVGFNLGWRSAREAWVARRQV